MVTNKSDIFGRIGEDLYLNERNADIIFKIRHITCFESVPAHTLLLSSSNDIFHAMFSSKDRKDVVIEGVSPAAFKEFLQFFYFSDVQLSKETIVDVMKLCEMYNVYSGLTVCEQFLKNNVIDDDICWAFDLSINHHLPSLRKLCETTIELNTYAVIRAPTFINCSQSALRQILMMDSMSCTEYDLFEACMSWALMNSHQNHLSTSVIQKQLGDLLHCFRFGAMSLNQFSTLIRSYGHLFTGSECSDIIEMISTPEYQSIYFLNNRRARIDGTPNLSEHRILCDRLISTDFTLRPYYIREVEITMFSTNTLCVLRKFRLSVLLIHHDKSYKDLKEPVKMNVSIFDENEHSACAPFVVVVKNKRTIWLPRPIIIQPGRIYSIQLEQMPPDTCCTAVTLNSFVDSGDGFTTTFHGNSSSKNDTTRGLIQELGFCHI